MVYTEPEILNVKTESFGCSKIDIYIFFQIFKTLMRNIICFGLNRGPPNLFGKGLQPLLWARSRAAREKNQNK